MLIMHISYLAYCQSGYKVRNMFIPLTVRDTSMYFIQTKNEHVAKRNMEMGAMIKTGEVKSLQRLSQNRLFAFTKLSVPAVSLEEDTAHVL